MIFLLSFLLLAPMAFAQDDPPLPSLKEANAQFTLADTALNQAWATLKGKLAADAFASLKEDQREWVKQRDYLALSPSYSGAPADEIEARKSAEYFVTAAALTEERTKWLNAFAKPLENNSLTGIWDDSNGGEMQIVQKDGKLYFTITVVRGPTAHSGDIGGIASWKSPKGFFSDKGLDPEKKDETTLTFLLKGNQIEVIGSNTGYYHGARAYFEGHYLCVAPLTAAEQAKVIEDSK